MIQYIYHSVNGHKYRDVYELKPCNEFGDEEFDLVGHEVLTPKCNWKNEFAFCSKGCTNCTIGQEFLEMIGVQH